MGRVYIHGRDNRPRGRTRRGRPKNYRHKFFNRTKKVVTGQSQNSIFLCFKSNLAYPRFGHARKMLLNVA